MLDKPWRERGRDSATMARLAKRKVQQLKSVGYLTTVESAQGFSEIPK